MSTDAISIYLSGHDFEYEARNTVRIFDMNIDIELIADGICEPYGGLCLVSELEDCSGDLMSRARLYDGDELLYHSEVHMDEMLLEKDDDKKSRKALTVKAMYNVLSKHYGVESQYGVLTGVRPVKILFTALKSGKGDREIYRILHDTYGVSDEKIKLLCKVASIESKYMDDCVNAHNYNLYLGIPFCPTRCSYCSFTSFAGKDEATIDAYLDTLLYEMRHTIELAEGEGLNLNTVYVGGGTPSVLSAAQMGRIFRALREYYRLDEIREISFEAGRPDTITEEKLMCLKDSCVGRISINPQTMNKDTLDAIGRKHDVEDIVKKYEMARKANIGCINMDVILGLPGEDEADVQNTVSSIASMKPENITVHSLAYKKGSALINERRNLLRKDYELLKGMHDVAESICCRNGYEPYYMYRQKNIKGNLENVGYTLPERESIYNIVIIEEIETILACGAGASSKIMLGNGRHESCHNFKSLEDYMKRTDEQLNVRKHLFELRHEISG